MSVESGQNGLLVTPPREGDTGALRKWEGTARPRAYLRHLQRQLNKADNLVDTDWDANAEFAKRCRDDPALPVRTRLCAMQTLQAMMDKGLVAAAQIAADVRPPTSVQVNIAVPIRVEFDRGG